ncbi:MAG TPA: Rnase Y domain-containing protein, partial [Candidatus Paceibacterota bacterium]|nr:Rnase Y domain-containing protein [Candidatus Paceibacterota bacterium]
MGAGYKIRQAVARGEKNSVEVEVKQLLLDAREEAERITADSEEKAKQVLAEAEGSLKEKEEKLARQEERMFKREEALDKKSADLDREVEGVKSRIEEVKSIKERAEALVSQRADELAKVAGLTKDQAKAELMQELERESGEDFMMRAAKLERDGLEKLDRKAKDILTTAIHRLGNSVASDTMATAITIPNDDIKGKIIGKEGRNIKAFERATGVEVIIDDTPGSIVLSSYDPIRRAIARVALE